VSGAAIHRTLIVGLGETGLSVARFLAARGEAVAITDSRAVPPMLDALGEELPDVAVFTGGFSAEAFAAAERIVVSPGVSLRQPLLAEAAARGVEIIGDIELFARQAKAPVLAITGSNGKSTVTALVGEMARLAGIDARVGGNFGTPALDLLGETEPALYVLELSSFQLETTYSLACSAAALLNISPDHLDRYTDVGEYAEAKARIFAHAEVCVLNADDPRVAAMAEACHGVVVRFSQGPAGPGDYGLLEVDGATWLCRGDERLILAEELRLVGRHNYANVLAALALGAAGGLPREAMLEGARLFAGLPHRCQWVAERNGVRWYDDSKGTNVGATLAAIAGLERPLVLIAGGDGKGQDFSPLRAALAEGVRAVVLIGRDAPQIEAAIAAVVPTVYAADMGEAVARAAELARPGDAVLLSPACASFDMFRNYEHRGEVFAQAVRGVAR